MIVKSESCARIQHCHRYRIALFLGYAIDRWYKNAIQRAYVVFELSHCFTRMSILSLVSFVSLIYITRKITRIATLEYTLGYDEYLTRASRSNTGTYLSLSPFSPWVKSAVRTKLEQSRIKTLFKKFFVPFLQYHPCFRSLLSHPCLR